MLGPLLKGDSSSQPGSFYLQYSLFIYPDLMMLAPGLSLLALVFGAAASSHHGSASQYDFVIVGGGTSGLVVANRLSELKNVTVAVIEAGDSVFNNANVTNVMGYSLAFGTEIDWAYETANQTYAGGLKQTIRAGKAIGGTSTINGNLSLLERT